jgi:hypothetical protein
MHSRKERGRRRPTRALILALVLFGLLTGSAGQALAEPDRSEQWVPAFELGVDIQFDERSASRSGNVAPSVKGTDTGSISIVRFGGELLAPRVSDRWGGPRPLARIGGQLTLVTKEILSEGNPSGGAFALLADAVEQQNRLDMGMSQRPGTMLFSELDPDDIKGEGSSVRVGQNVRPTWYASLGVAWEFESPVHEGWLRIKPSIEYAADEFRYDGLFVDVIEPSPDVFELTTLRAGRRVREHRIGPGLELEALLTRSEPVTISLFLSTRFLFLVSDRYNSWGGASSLGTTTFDDVNDIQSTASTGKTTRFTAESERFLVRLGGGFRIAFVGP